MDIIEAVNTRKSIRGFKKDPVPKEILRDILEISCRAPSGSNSQPWEFSVVGGDILEKIRQENVKMFRSGASVNLYPTSSSSAAASIYQKRSMEVTRMISELMGIERNDVEMN